MSVSVAEAQVKLLSDLATLNPYVVGYNVASHAIWRQISWSTLDRVTIRMFDVKPLMPEPKMT